VLESDAGKTALRWGGEQARQACIAPSLHDVAKEPPSSN
jgi:hypothetical protein